MQASVIARFSFRGWETTFLHGASRACPGGRPWRAASFFFRLYSKRIFFRSALDSSPGAAIGVFVRLELSTLEGCPPLFLRRGSPFLLRARNVLFSCLTLRDRQPVGAAALDSSRRIKMHGLGDGSVGFFFFPGRGHPRKVVLLSYFSHVVLVQRPSRATERPP